MNNEIIAKIEAKVKQKEAQRARLKQLEMLKLSNFIDDNDLIEIEKEIQFLKSILNFKGEKTLDQLDKLFDNFDLNVGKIENTKFTYLFKNFIVKNELTMTASPPATGKSLISVALCNIFLIEETIKQVIYFDGDNGAATIKERNIHKLKQHWGSKFRYFHESSASKAQMWQIIKQLQKTDLTDVFIVFDSIKNFMNGGDRDKNKDVSKIMEVLQSLRARGATVLFLHHTNKPNKDLQELVYAGSSAFQEDTGNAYILSKNEFKGTFIFKNFKARTGNLKDVAFRYVADSHTLIQVDFQEASETEEDQQIKNEIIEFITNNPKCTYSLILQHVTSMGYGKDKVNKVIQAGKSKHWQAIKNKAKQNRDEYILIEIENISKKGEITDFVSDNKITSDNSYFGGIEEKKESQIESDNYCDLLKVEQNMNIDIPTL
ncbi:AAA family ATPase [Sulfurimonas sediminis]|uniref:AAA family ATPase n=1 Tax=Sulfurimonas sediminis TaxID=2590020 RepID=A0A7M1B1J0_9BACT|nr:AAA family ATPase [Sulfurimonas sediminis]QOP43629.1 AAA family ATPase [Sulfurimonas sediminis]